MRDVTRDPFAFNEGDKVVKLSGDYTFRGVVVSRFHKRSGAPRYIVENDDGVVHIFSANQLSFDNSP
jgi:hypothetical protein